MVPELSAIVPVGTHADKSKLIYGENKAFLEINNKPLLYYPLKALQNSRFINKIGIVGPREKLEKVLSNTSGIDYSRIQIIDESLAPKESRRIIENVLNGYKNISQKRERVIYVAGDLPFIQRQDVERFILKTEENKVSVSYGILGVEKIPNEIESLKKCQKSFLVGLGDCRTSGLFSFDSRHVRDQELLEALIGKAFPLRRTSSKLSKVRLGAFFIRHYTIPFFKYITHRLTEQDMKDALKKKPGITFKLVDVKSPRAVIDIDDVEEYEFIKKHFDYLSKELDSRY